MSYIGSGRWRAARTRRRDGWDIEGRGDIFEDGEERRAVHSRREEKGQSRRSAGTAAELLKLAPPLAGDADISLDPVQGGSNKRSATAKIKRAMPPRYSPVNRARVSPKYINRATSPTTKLGQIGRMTSRLSPEATRHAPQQPVLPTKQYHEENKLMLGVSALSVDL